jgi:transcriptional regulator with XRE-family HTH domain
MDKVQESFFKKFGAIVRQLRLERGLTLEDMQEYGFSAQHFQKVEAGKKAVNLFTANRIANAFNISTSKLLKNI